MYMIACRCTCTVSMNEHTYADLELILVAALEHAVLSRLPKHDLAGVSLLAVDDQRHAGRVGGLFGRYQQLPVTICS